MLLFILVKHSLLPHLINSVPILTSIYQATNSENNNTYENREPTMQVPKSDNAITRERVIQIPPYAENIENIP